MFSRVREFGTMISLMARAGLIAPLRPDRYVRMIQAVRREGPTQTVGFAAAAQRFPDRPGLVDEIGMLTWRELDERCDAFAAALDGLAGSKATTVGIMCRNHRGFVEALVGANRLGADVVLLNTSFAGPALAEVTSREGVEIIVYDEEFEESIALARADNPNLTTVLAWTDGVSSTELTVERLIATHRGEKPHNSGRKGTLILLTSGTTGTPKGARRRSGDGPGALVAILGGVPWRVGETTVVAAPMFHAWGFFQLVFSAMMACTIVTRRKFDPEATLELIDRYRATGLGVVPVMIERIMALPADVRRRYNCGSLRFAAASGSRMRGDVVTAFMDEFGEIVYNNYNATETGMVTIAKPEDLRAAPDTAGKPVAGTEIRILDDLYREVGTGEVGQIYVCNNTAFDGFTSGETKHSHAGFMATGDVGYLDAAGRLFVVGRDDEMIVSGGENVYPIEVEQLLIGHPDVTEVSVIGVDDEQFGQRLAAFVVLRAGAATGPESLKQYVRDNLANYKVPREIKLLDELPRSSTGKIVRRELQALLRPAG